MITIDQIHTINKNLPKQYVARVAKYIDKASKYYKVPSHIYTAIIAQESMFKMVNTKTDYGVSQIHTRTVGRYNLNKYKLSHDLRYSIYAGAKVLADFKRMYGKRECDWWSRYHNSKEPFRSKYKKMVSKYMFISVRCLNDRFNRNY